MKLFFWKLIPKKVSFLILSYLLQLLLVLGVILSSVESIDKKIGHLLKYIEWIFILFSIEYL